MPVLRCISPIDGSVYAERETLSPDAARALVARDAQGAEGVGRPARSPTASRSSAPAWRASAR